LNKEERRSILHLLGGGARSAEKRTQAATTGAIGKKKALPLFKYMEPTLKRKAHDSLEGGLLGAERNGKDD